jgi:molecular chaperone DnaK
VNRVVFVGGPTRMPAVRAFFEELFGHPGEQGVDPMECVAAGAAIQAGVLAGELGEIVLVDVTPLTLGVETLGGVATPLIARNTPIPVARTESFTTAADMQPSVTVRVVQGERPMAADNTGLGQFNVDGIPPAPRGVPKIDVSFDIDANGILDVTARDTATGRAQSIRITGSTRLSPAEKERMIKDAERYADEDRRHREDAEALNNADSVCYQAERTLAEFAEMLTDDLRQRITAALAETKQAVAEHHPQQASARADQLKTILQEAGSILYTAANAPPPPREGAPKPQPPSGERGRRVVNAQYEEV